MECRALDLTIISARGLKSVSKYDVYVVVRGTGGEKRHTTPSLAGSSELKWNFPIKFTIDEAEAMKDGLHLEIKIMVVNWLIRKTLGKIRVSIKDLMEGITEEGKKRELIRFPVVNWKLEETGASLTLSYEFGKKFLHKVEAPYTKSGSEVEKSSLESGELLTAVAAVSWQGYGRRGYGGVRGFGIGGWGGGGGGGGGCGGWGGGGCGGGGGGGGCGGGGGGGGCGGGGGGC